MPERFWRKVDRRGNNECWLWLASTDGKGYGTFRVPGGTVRAHRWLYETTVGLVPEGLVLDHLCRTRNCVNPLHLEPVTSGENTRRGTTGRHHAIKTHCPQGHLYDDANTYLFGPDKRWRGCRQCRNTYSAAYKRKRSLFGVPAETSLPMTQNVSSEPLNTRVVDEDTTYVLATSKGRAAGLFAQLLAKGKTFTVAPVEDAYCEFWISEENESRHE